MPPAPAARPGRSFREAIARGALTGDGAMGSALHDRGFPFDVCYEALALSRPDVVQRIHEDHLRAGADVIETDTFGANRFRLARHGLEGRVREINVAAVRLARGVAGGRAYVAGALGPTGLASISAADEVRAAFREQAAALVEGGADALVLETLRSAREIELALEGAREAVARDVPIVAQVSVDEPLSMADGTPVAAVGRRLVALGADVVGVNCGAPAVVAAAVEALLPLGVPLSAMPSAGIPKRAGDRFVYPVTPAEIGAFARRMRAIGVRLVGGCCGTTPEHVQRIAAAMRAALMPAVAGGG
jgi:homocysteine S-methyltransferase